MLITVLGVLAFALITSKSSPSFRLRDRDLFEVNALIPCEISVGDFTRLQAAEGDEAGEDCLNCLRFEYFHK